MLLIVLLISQVGAELNAADQQLLSKAAERTELIQSGDFEFTYSMCRAKPPRKNPLLDLKMNGTGPHPLKEAYEDEQVELPLQSYQLKLADEGWVLRYPGSQSFSMSRKEFAADFGAGTRSDPPSPFLVLKGSEGEILSEPVKIVWKRFLRSGCFPYQKMSTFVQKHKTEATLLGRMTLDDMNCKVFEWTISVRNMMELPYGIGSAGVVRDFVTLRIAVCEELSGAVCRCEFSDIDGRLHTAYSNLDFKEVTDGVYFPMINREERMSPDDVNVSEFAFKKIENINQNVDASTFNLVVPDGTTVDDGRPGKPRTSFKARDYLGIGNIEEFVRRNTAK